MDTKETIRLIARQNRDAIIDFYMDGHFEKLPAYTGTELSRENRIRGLPQGWVVPENCYGRAGLATDLQRETIRQFIYRNFPGEAKNTMVALESWHDSPAIVIYKRIY